MPILKDFRRTKEITLSKHEGSKIEIYDGIVVKEAMSFNKDEENSEKSLDLIAKMIKSWNFTDEQEKPLPVNIESLYLFDMESLTELSTQINEFSNFVKKKD